MGKKKRSQAKRGKGKPFAFVGPLFRFTLRLLPFVIIILGCGGIFLGVKDALYADAGLGIQKVEVVPADSLSANQRQALDGMLLGKNIMNVDLKKVSSVMEKDPGIHRAVTVKHLPNQVSVLVERRHAVACIQFASQGNCGMVSEDGVILDVIPSKNATGLIIESFESGKREPQLGMKVSVKGFSEAISFLRAYEKMELSRFETLTRIGIDHLGNVSIILGNGPQIRLGRRPLESLKSLEKTIPLLKSEERSRLEYVDLQYDNVIVKRKK